MGARCTISLNELVHSGIMGTGPDNKLGRGLNAKRPLPRLLSGPVPIIPSCTSSFSDIVHLAPIIHCCEMVRIPTYLPLLCFTVVGWNKQSIVAHLKFVKIDRERKMLANVLFYFILLFMV